MLKPAILYKDIIEKKFAEQLYTDDYFWYTGYGMCNDLPEIAAQDERWQWAIVSPETEDQEEKVIGYFAYQIVPETDSVMNFGWFSFDRGNPLVARNVFDKMEELVREHRRVEWRMIGGNPVKRGYDHFCKRHNGNSVCLHQVTKDVHGEYHDEYIYEILREV